MGPGPWVLSQVERRKVWKGAAKTAATSLGSRRGIMVSSTEGEGDEDEDEEELVEVDEAFEGRRNATQGRTPSSVFARFAGSSQRCSTWKPGGSLVSVVGRPISS
jgi:hypothetical protein